MPVSRKPQRPQAASAGVDVDALIRKGGSVPEEQPSADKRKIVPVTLRIPAGLLKQVDAHLSKQPVPLPRHTWILEAVHEKLSRSANGQ